MPLISDDDYRPPFLFRQRDLATIAPALLRQVRGIKFQRESIETPDGDFFDVDWPVENSGKGTLAILVHGLEGNSKSQYMLGMIRALRNAEIDTLAYNFRGCSGRPNRLLKSYHSAFTEDLTFLVERLVEQGKYDRLVVIGFSLGGLVTLKYLGEQGENLPSSVKAGVAIGTPCDVAASCRRLQRPRNIIYLTRFLVTLRAKALAKKKKFPEAPFSSRDVRYARNFIQYDNSFTAPIHGFRDADHYYSVATSHQYIPQIQVPTLLLNAKNDPFLTKDCYPVDLARQNPHFHLEIPRFGGHVGFSKHSLLAGEFHSEARARSFLEEVL